MKLFDYLSQRRVYSNIKRFGMETTIGKQNLSEHGFSTGTLFYLLCKEMQQEITADQLFMVMNHDFAETYTSDLNMLVKHKSEKTKEAWKIIEKEALPEELKHWSDQEIEKKLSPELLVLFKTADFLDAYLYCVDELNKGNLRFRKPKGLYVKRLNNLLKNNKKLTMIWDTIHYVEEKEL